MQSVDSIETHACGMSKDLVCKEELNITVQQNIVEMLTLIILWKKTKEHNPNWPLIPDYTEY